MISLRRAEESDAEMLTRICVDAFKLESVVVGRPPPGHDRIEFHRRVIAEADVRVVLRYDRPVGAVTLLPFGRFGRDIRVGLFFIVRAHQSRGLGSAAWSLIEAEIPPGKLIAVDVAAASVRGRAFCRRLGFTERCELKPAFLGDGNLRLVRSTKRARARPGRVNAWTRDPPPLEPVSSEEPASPF